MSVKTTEAGESAASRCGAAKANGKAAPARPSNCKNPRRDWLRLELLLTLCSGLRQGRRRIGAAAPLFLQIIRLLVEAREYLQCLLAFFRLSEPAKHAGQNVVIRGGPWVKRDGLGQGINRVVQLALALLRLGLLKPGPVGLGIKFDGLAGVGEAFFGIAGAVVVRAQVNVGGGELAVTGLV